MSVVIDVIWCEAICFNFPREYEDISNREGWLCPYKATMICMTCKRPVCDHHLRFECCNGTAKEQRPDAEARGRNYLMPREEMARVFRTVYGDTPGDAAFKFFLSPSGGCVVGALENTPEGKRFSPFGWLNFRADGKIEKGVLWGGDSWQSGEVIA